MKKKALLAKILLAIAGITILVTAVFLLRDRMFPKAFSDIAPNEGQFESCQILCADGEKVLNEKELEELVARLEQLQYYKQGAYSDVMEGNVYHAYFSAWEEEPFVLHISDAGKVYTDSVCYEFAPETDPQTVSRYLEAFFQTIPEDFSFALTWGAFGISSYDSQTGKLVKTTDATNPSDYVTNYQLTEEEKAHIFYDLIYPLNVDAYPGMFDPSNGISTPSRTLILTVRMNGTEKTIKAKDISFSNESEDAKGQAFLSTCKAISDLLKATEEWKALPDYEVIYE